MRLTARWPPVRRWALRWRGRRLVAVLARVKKSPRAYFVVTAADRVRGEVTLDEVPFYGWKGNLMNATPGRH